MTEAWGRPHKEWAHGTPAQSRKGYSARQWMSVECPKCHAEPGRRCLMEPGNWMIVHKQREAACAQNRMSQ